MSFYLVEQFPILPPSAYSTDDLDFIVPRVLELTYTSYSMTPLPGTSVTLDHLSFGTKIAARIFVPISTAGMHSPMAFRVTNSVMCWTQRR